MCRKDWLLKRADLSLVNLLAEIRAFPEDFDIFMRMDEEAYLQLLPLVSPFISRRSKAIREAISPYERLTANLSCLDIGRSLQVLKLSACIVQPTLQRPSQKHVERFTLC